MLMAPPPGAIPGYSPWPTARQDSPFLQTPGIQGITEGVQGGQQMANTPTQQFEAGGQQGTAAPASVPNPGQMWSTFGGSGGAPSSFSQGSAPAIIQALLSMGGQM